VETNNRFPGVRTPPPPVPACRAGVASRGAAALKTGTGPAAGTASETAREDGTGADSGSGVAGISGVSARLGSAHPPSTPAPATTLLAVSGRPGDATAASSSSSDTSSRLAAMLYPRCDSARCIPAATLSEENTSDSTAAGGRVRRSSGGGSTTRPASAAAPSSSLEAGGSSVSGGADPTATSSEITMGSSARGAGRESGKPGQKAWACSSMSSSATYCPHSLHTSTPRPSQCTRSAWGSAGPLAWRTSRQLEFRWRTTAPTDPARNKQDSKMHAKTSSRTKMSSRNRGGAPRQD